MAASSASAAIPVSMNAPRELRAQREPNPPSRQHAAGQWQDWLFEHTTLFFALFVLGTLLFILLALGYAAIPAFDKFGLGFFTTNVWNPVKSEFGALAPIYGTLVTSLIALLIGVPVSFGIALFLTEMCPPMLKRPLGTAVELLAAIPSIIYGMWGLFVFAPIFGDYIQPLLAKTFGNMWLIAPLFQGAPNGIGCTTWEVVWNIVLPYTRVGVIGGIMLGLGRALGETMAVTFVIGNAYRINASLFAPGNSIASALANEFNEASDPVHRASLFALGLVLFLLTFIVLACSRFMLAQLAKGEGRKT